MATGVKPRDEESRLTRTDLENIQDAMKNKQFRDLLRDYCEEVRDPANQAIYQKEMTQLEKERGYDVTFINPKGGYVIKTSVAGDRKAFINICSSDTIAKPSCKTQVVNGQKGMNWQIPYSMIPPREDYNEKKEKCVIYDVVFHPDTLRMAEVNKQFRELVNKTAFEGLSKQYGIHLDSNNCRFPKSQYKGASLPAVLRSEDPNYKPPSEEETEDLSPEVIEKLYPQHIYEKQTEKPIQPPQKTNKTKTAEFSHSTENGYTIPKYVIKQQKNIDLQDYTYHKDSKENVAIPSHIVVEVDLPLLSSTRDCTLDVQEKYLHLTSEKPAKYKLSLTLPYSVDDERGNAKFDKSKHRLMVTLPVIRKNTACSSFKSLKVDSGVESEEYSESQSDEEKEQLIVELSSTPAEPSPITQNLSTALKDTFLEPSLGYLLPPYTHNILDDVIAFTFHVKNTDPDSVKVKKEDNTVIIKFTSIGSGFVPVHYAAMILFNENVNFDNVTGEAWDNNVILQMEVTGDVSKGFQIGVNQDSLTSECFEMSEIKKTKVETSDHKPSTEDVQPVVEVTNLGTETNIILSSNTTDLDEDDFDSPISKESGEETIWNDPCSYESSAAKSILRKTSIMRSFSESSAGDIASSMDYISSDCIPEESSLKKTVRFSDVIAKQFYRYNSSIEGQKKKNQRKKSKKRTLERRKSESEAEDDYSNFTNTTKPRLKSVLKQRRDSGLADTSDAETECKDTVLDSDTASKETEEENFTNGNDHVTNSAASSVLNIIDNHAKEPPEPIIWETDTTLKTKEESPKQETCEPVTCDTIKHNTALYNPENLNKGQYLEIAFKNDLIFDLDM